MCRARQRVQRRSATSLPTGRKDDGRVQAKTQGPLYRRVAQDLEQQIADGTLGPGDKLPSERQLCERYDVSQITVRRALRELAHEGQVYSQHGLGWFVGDDSVLSPKRARAVLIVERMAWPAAAIAARAATELARAQVALDLCLWPSGVDEPQGGQVVQHEADLALYCPMGERDEALARRARLDAWGIPVLGVGYELDDGAGPGVYLDVALASRSITQHLLDQGRVGLAYLGAGPSSALGHAAYWSFAETLWEAGFDLPLEWVLDSGALGHQHDRLAALLRSSARPDGIVCSSGEDAALALSAIYAAELRCPGNVALAALGDEDLPLCMTPAITSYRFDMQALGRAVASSAERLLAGEVVGSERVAGELVLRSSSIA